MKKIILTAVIGLSLGLGASTAFADGEHAKVFMETSANVALAASKMHATGPKRSSLLRTVN